MRDLACGCVRSELWILWQTKKIHFSRRSSQNENFFRKQCVVGVSPGQSLSRTRVGVLDRSSPFAKAVPISRNLMLRRW
jgi:hypothetical protein